MVSSGKGEIRFRRSTLHVLVQSTWQSPTSNYAGLPGRQLLGIVWHCRTMMTRLNSHGPTSHPSFLCLTPINAVLEVVYMTRSTLIVGDTRVHQS